MDKEARLFGRAFLPGWLGSPASCDEAEHLMALLPLNPPPAGSDLLDCNLCYLNRLYATHATTACISPCDIDRMASS